MATSASLTECAICKGETQDPRILKCVHSFCYQCLVTLQQQSQRPGISCPVCRKTTNKKPYELPRDFRIEQIRELKPVLEAGERQILADAQKEATKVTASIPSESQQKQKIADCEAKMQQSQRCKETAEELHQVLTDWLESAKKTCSSIAEQYSSRQKQLESRKSWEEKRLAARQLADQMTNSAGTPDVASMQRNLDKLRSLQEQPIPYVGGTANDVQFSVEDVEELKRLICNHRLCYSTVGTEISNESGKKLLLKLVALSGSSASHGTRLVARGSPRPERPLKPPTVQDRFRHFPGESSAE